MAKLKNIDTIWIAPSGTPVTVGNNRTITRSDYNALSGADSVDLPPTFECRLHGHLILEIEMGGASGLAHITLNDCGYLTATTIAAMSDFMGVFGISGRASRAGGKLSLRVRGAGGAWLGRDASARGAIGPVCVSRHHAT